MRIDLICSGGLTSSWIVKKVEEYISSRKLPYELTSRGLGDYIRFPVMRTRFCLVRRSATTKRKWKNVWAYL